MNDERGTMNKAPDLRERLVQYSLDIVRLYTSLPKSGPGNVMGYQLLRSGTSVGAQHREASRARSTAEFISKMESSLQELDESAYWLELILAAELSTGALAKRLKKETEELISIFTSSVKTAKKRGKK